MKNDKDTSKKRKEGESLIDRIKKLEEKNRLEENNQLNILSKTTINKRLVFVMVFFVALFMTLAC